MGDFSDDFAFDSPFDSPFDLIDENEILPFSEKSQSNIQPIEENQNDVQPIEENQNDVQSIVENQNDIHPLEEDKPNINNNDPSPNQIKEENHNPHPNNQAPFQIEEDQTTIVELSQPIVESSHPIIEPSHPDIQNEEHHQVDSQTHTQTNSISNEPITNQTTLNHPQIQSNEPDMMSIEEQLLILKQQQEILIRQQQLLLQKQQMEIERKKMELMNQQQSEQKTETQTHQIIMTQQQSDPQVNQQTEQQVIQQSDPQVNQQPEPQLIQQSDPQVNQQSEQQVNQQPEPQLIQQSAPQLIQQSDPQIIQSEPQVNQYTSSQMNQQLQPPKSQLNSGNVDVSLMWKEAIAPNGRTYYYNKVTKQTTWKRPPEYKVEDVTSTPNPPQQTSNVTIQSHVNEDHNKQQETIPQSTTQQDSTQQQQSGNDTNRNSYLQTHQFNNLFSKSDELIDIKPNQTNSQQPIPQDQQQPIPQDQQQPIPQDQQQSNSQDPQQSIPQDQQQSIPQDQQQSNSLASSPPPSEDVPKPKFFRVKLPDDQRQVVSFRPHLVLRDVLKKICASRAFTEDDFIPKDSSGNIVNIELTLGELNLSEISFITPKDGSKAKNDTDSKKSKRILSDIYQTNSTLSNSLLSMIKNYKDPLLEISNSSDPKVRFIKSDQIKQLFDPVEFIANECHAFKQLLSKHIETWPIQVNEPFFRHLDIIPHYLNYVNHFNDTMKIIEDLRNNSLFCQKLDSIQRKNGNQLRIEDFFLLPANKIGSMVDLVNELILLLGEEHENFTLLKELYDRLYPHKETSLKIKSEYLSRSKIFFIEKNVQKIPKKLQFINQNRRNFYREGILDIEIKKNSKATPFYVFIFTDFMLICKYDEKKEKKSATYVFNEIVYFSKDSTMVEETMSSGYTFVLQTENAKKIKTSYTCTVTHQTEGTKADWILSLKKAIEENNKNE